MDEPVDTPAVAAHLRATLGLGSTDVPSAYRSNWLDNTGTKFDLNLRPRYDLAKLIHAAWTYQRAPTIHGRSVIRADGREADRLLLSMPLRVRDNARS
jgi:hypothetical protein